MPDLKEFNAEYISNVVLSKLKNRGINKRKIVGAIGDGASSIIGKNSGVFTRMLSHCPLFAIIHDAHKVNLISQGILKKIP